VISIIDDDRFVLEAMARLVRSLGFTAVVFQSAGEFLEGGTVDRTDCLITDVQMPGMTGIELYRRLTNSLRPIPTILVTAYPDESVRARMLAEGIVDYLRKPVEETILLACLRSALDRRRS
jgi:FixJ family two-component response regulator